MCLLVPLLAPCLLSLFLCLAVPRGFAVRCSCCRVLNAHLPLLHPGADAAHKNLDHVPPYKG